MSTFSRRDFFKTTAGVAAAGLLSTGARAQAPPAGSIAVRVTDATRKFAEAPALAWRSAAGSVPTIDAISLDPMAKSQEYLGIGGAFTDAACYMFNLLSDDARAALEKALKMSPKADYVVYALAALDCLTGETESAMENLKQAIALRPENRYLARNDEDFAYLQDDPRFTELLYPEGSAS